MKLSKLKKQIDELKMSRILLSFNRCVDCGKCCFDCEYLDRDYGCTNNTFRLSTRCASFPILLGIPSLMGHRDNKPSDRIIDKEAKDKIWFIYDYPECVLQQDEILFNNLRWILDDINSEQKITFFHVQIEERELSLENQK